MATKLLYLTDMCQLNAEAQVEEIISPDEQNTYSIIILDQTVFYPQGGGQPSDKGIIKNTQGTFEVQAVAKQEDKVHHKGTFQNGTFKPGAVVELCVDAHLRSLHNKNHTAGHLIDYALANLGYSFAPKKAYHFPQGPYVEYDAELQQDEREQLKIVLEKEINIVVEKALPVKIDFLNGDLQQRVMLVEGYPPILCGGTHVTNTRDIGQIAIRKIKNEKGSLRISYAVI